MIGNRRVLAIVPARAGSQRLPGTNVRPLAGRPMVAWTLDAAQRSTVIDRIVVSTDDPAGARIATDMGYPPPFVRPDSLSGADASVIDAIAHALDQVGEGWDYVVLLQPTSPLRRPADIDAAVSLCDARNAPAVIGVSALPKPPAFYGAVDAEGRFEAAAAADRRVVINGAVYVGRPEVLLRERTFQSEGALAHLMPFERSWDVDTLAEFAVCEALFPFRGAGEADQ
jgi:N-acylneuraminate cytidylyltransferase